MRTRYETMTSGAIDSYANFIGDDKDYRDWYNFLGQARDSEALDRSNFIVATAELERVDPEGRNWRSESYNHWAHGWIEEIYVRPGIWKATLAAILMRGRIDNYPVLDEDHYCELENEEACEVWKTCYDNSERIAYMREYPDQFEFYDFACLIGCARGDYFNGYASELLH